MSAPDESLPFAFDPALEVTPEPAGRHRLYAALSDQTWVLGANELRVARAFDGRRSAAQIAAGLRETHGLTVSPQRVAAFGTRLHALGVLVVPGEPRRRDRFAGLSYGPWKARLLVTLFDVAPEPYLDALLRRLPWLTARGFLACCGLLVAVALALVWHGRARLGPELPLAFGGYTWLLWYYPIALGSIVVHELGHALACKAYGVRTTFLGVGIYPPFVTGWSRPVQHEWSRLPRGPRVVTILMGPAQSIVIAALGSLVWAFAQPASALANLGLLVAVVASFSTIPTLLPIFNGDGYLLLTELCRTPSLREQSWRFVRDAVRGRSGWIATLSWRRRLLYGGMVTGTVASWCMAWTYATWVVVRHLHR